MDKFTLSVLFSSVFPEVTMSKITMKFHPSSQVIPGNNVTMICEWETEEYGYATVRKRVSWFRQLQPDKPEMIFNYDINHYEVVTLNDAVPGYGSKFISVSNGLQQHAIVLVNGSEKDEGTYWCTVDITPYWHDVIMVIIIVVYLLSGSIYLFIKGAKMRRI